MTKVTNRNVASLASGVSVAAPVETTTPVAEAVDRAARVAVAAAKILARSTKDPETGCLRWNGPVTAQGYVQVRIPRGPTTGGHRVMKEWAEGAPLPAGQPLDHLCHTRSIDTCTGGPTCLHRRCMNPDHLEMVTNRENIRRGWKAQTKVCQRGHAFDEANTGINSHGGRYCITCQRAKNKECAERRKFRAAGITSSAAA